MLLTKFVPDNTIRRCCFCPKFNANLYRITQKKLENRHHSVEGDGTKMHKCLVGTPIQSVISNKNMVLKIPDI